MDTNLKKEKLALWRKQLVQLEKDLAEAMLARGKAAEEGDLSENAAYKDFTEKTEMISAQIATYQRMIKEIEKGA